MRITFACSLTPQPKHPDNNDLAIGSMTCRYENLALQRTTETTYDVEFWYFRDHDGTINLKKDGKPHWRFELKLQEPERITNTSTATQIVSSLVALPVRECMRIYIAAKKDLELLAKQTVVSWTHIAPRLGRFEKTFTTLSCSETQTLLEPGDQYTAFLIASGARSLSIIAKDIRDHWKKPNPAANDPISCMASLSTLEDDFHQDRALEIVGKFTFNAQGWRGEHARRIKKELNDMMKTHDKFITATEAA